jgi:threonine dehydrogenase-like Zn-dependent dehydrogenase
MLKAGFLMRSKAVVQVADRHFEMQEFEVPVIGADEALLRVETCGLCGSDIEQFNGGLAKAGIISYPIIPGHEPVGIIEEIGPDAARRWGVQRGDRVAVEPNISCGFCSKCLRGSTHLCQRSDDRAYGYTPLTGERDILGAYSQYLHLKPRTILHRIPKTMPLELASMYQILASGIRWAVEVPQTGIGDSVLIFGPGQRGLGAVIACREAGARTIIVTGLAVDRHKLDLALAFGATHVIVADQEDVVERVMQITGGRGVSIALDVVPTSTHPIVQALDVVERGGSIILAGIKGPDSPLKIASDQLIVKEIRMQGVYTQTTASYEKSIAMLEQNKYDLGRLHTHSFPLEQAEEAVATLAGKFPDRKAVNVSLMPW